MNVTKARKLVTACLALCVIVWLASTARAQTQSSDYTTPNNAQVCEGAGDIRPIFPLNLYSALRLRGTPLETTVPGLLHQAQGPEYSLLTNSTSLQPGSLLYPLQTKYLMWESRLADDVPLTNQKGLLVYPLVRIRLANVDLPIGLYVPPLRGSDAK
jgi:hypothetical protein